MSAAKQPVTLARIERALDRLAVIMTEHRDIAEDLLPIYRRLEREAEVFLEKESAFEAIRARARRSQDRTAAQS